MFVIFSFKTLIFIYESAANNWLKLILLTNVELRPKEKVFFRVWTQIKLQSCLLLVKQALGMLYNRKAFVPLYCGKGETEKMRIIEIQSKVLENLYFFLVSHTGLPDPFLSLQQHPFYFILVIKGTVERPYMQQCNHYTKFWMLIVFISATNYWKQPYRSCGKVLLLWLVMFPHNKGSENIYLIFFFCRYFLLSLHLR